MANRLLWISLNAITYSCTKPATKLCPPFTSLPRRSSPRHHGQEINRSHRQRAAKRACEILSHMTTRLSAAANHLDAANRIPHVPGFVATPRPASSGQVGELKYWIGQGYVFSEMGRIDCIVAALPGHPPGADWDESIRQMCDCFRKVREETANCFTYEDLHHRRAPGTLKQSHKAKEEAVKMLSSEPWALRFSAFQSHAFGQNFPQEFAHYKVILGGHLVLHKFKLVIEFPSGATALIPSATVTHSNTPLQEGEEHFSFTQYAAGGLFRWVEYGHMKEGDFKLSDREAWLAATSPAACKARVSAGLARFSKYDELPDNLKTVFPVKDTSSKSL
ncbi:hypothetical protein B0H10DRAFT_1949981 [Mycena sp. CBHHK59/15]|nr:hypothetical protein B0H10DRAFT_1949981 [Mycena sp. CBHHK59/15]